MRFFMFAASLNQQSINKKLITLAAQIIRSTGNTVDLAEFNEFSAPLYSIDLQNQGSFPAPVMQFVERITHADAIIISVPEYNFSIPGAFKNLIDWVSRIAPQPWAGKKMMLLSASPALVGGNRGLWATRVPLEACGTIIHPDMFSLASAYEAFGEDSKLKDNALQQRLEASLINFTKFIQKLQD